MMRTKRILLVLLSTFFIFSTGCEKPEKPEILVADFSYTRDNVQPPVTVTFSNLSLNATSYLWDFGDNEGSSEMNPSHIYQTEGYVTVKLTAFNSDGTSSITKTEVISIGILICKIISLSLINMPFVNGTGASWDAGSGPDVFFKITPYSNPSYVYFNAIDNRFNDIASSSLPLLWSYSTGILTCIKKYGYSIDFWDYDPEDQDDYLGGITFNPSSFNTYPADVTITNQGVTVKLTLQWQ
jgi:hypothetical protein